mmetsp:Transcript_121195/g.376768  ORF Transcript_121195/g.376768 Transcript_121195/m.376768 type:complete len:486 (+) Transcript_121195:225-1682(+)
MPPHGPRTKPAQRPVSRLAAHRNLLHGRHVAAELTAHDLNRMRADGIIDGHQSLVVNTVAGLVELGANDVRVDFGHEVLQEWDAGLRVEVTAILRSVRDDLVHLVKLFACNGVRDERGLVERLVVGALRLHANGDHLFEGKLDTSLDHRNHEHSVVKVLLIRDLHIARGRLLEVCLGGLGTPLQEVCVVIVPVRHHGARENARDDVILVLRVERLHDALELLCKLEGLYLRRVVQAVHHADDAAMLQRLGDGLPTILNELRCVTRLDALLHHLVETEDGTRLEHATEDGLLAHEVALHLRNEGAQEDAGTIPAGGRCVGLGQIQALALGVVLWVHGDERRHAETPLVLLADLRAGALWSHHDDSEVIADLHALLHNVEAVAVGKGSTLLHEGHHLGYHIRVLLVWREVQHHVSTRHQLIVCANIKTVAGGIDKARALQLYGVLSECVADLAARVPHVQALIQALRAATNDDEVLVLDLRDAVGKL